MIALKHFHLVAFVIVACNVESADRKCHSVPLIDGYEREKSTGVWYTIQTNSEIEAKQKCIKFNLEAARNTHGRVVLTKSWKFGSKYMSLVFNMSPSNISAFTIHWLKGSTTLASVIGTDFSSYFISYVCMPGHKHGGIILISARQPNPVKSFLQKVYDVLAKKGFKVDPSDLLDVDHNDCQN